VGDRLVAKWKLARRYRRITRLYPQPLTSLLDVGCSKGFFVLAADQQPCCDRALGIDVQRQEIEACEGAKAFLGADRATFLHLRLHELADSIESFGGPFQTVLVINCYQYLYFGSKRCPDRYLDHQEIFRLLRRLCSGRLIFNNRTELARVQQMPRRIAQETGHDERLYNTRQILAVAAEFFQVAARGHIGSIPVWTMDAR
jgi:hypothetical protein